MKVKEILGNKSVWIPNKDYEIIKPHISVLLPTFSRARDGYFRRAVESVLKQSYKDIELIIIDDCSVDGTFDIIKSLMEEDSRISCIRHTENIGLPAISEYEAYIKARGEYIAFIFDDNEWEEDAIKETIAFMKKQNLKATYGIAKLRYGNSENEYIELGNIIDVNIDNILCDNFIANGSVVLHREVIENVGLYDPHLSLTRLCDWDLWRRVSRKYEFVPTGIQFTCEHGFILNDSLGNSYKMDIWAAEEQMRLYRDELLRPTSYAEYNIIDSNGGRSQFFIDCMHKYVQQYEKKEWFAKNKVQILNELNNINVDIARKRVIILADAITASTVLYFNRIFKKGQHILKFCLTNSIYTGNLALTDALVIERNNYSTEKYIDSAIQAGIPCYYFVDDNFIELYEENRDDKNLKYLAEYTTSEKFKEFKGIILSCPNMIEYFEKNNFHDNLILLEPGIDIENIREYAEKRIDNNVSIAFIGGKFRNETLVSCVLPALKEISKEVKVNFYCPDDNDEEILAFSDDNLKIITIDRSLSLDTTINRFKKKNIDIQIHCGSKIENNKFKTQNAIINSVQLGAVLITSKVPPFDEILKKECYLTCNNTKDEWYKKLKFLIEQDEVRKEIYRNAYELCMERYNADKTAEQWRKELYSIEAFEYYKLNKQYEALYLELYKEKNQILATSSATLAMPSIKLRKPINSSILRFTGPIDKKRKYDIICDVPYMTEIGIIFAAYGECSGQVSIKIICKDYTLREATVDMKDIIYNDWTYFAFDCLYGCGGKKLTLLIEFNYHQSKNKLGMFEDKRYRTFVYKAFNKIKKPVSGLNVIYVDCRK